MSSETNLRMKREAGSDDGNASDALAESEKRRKLPKLEDMGPERKTLTTSLEELNGSATIPKGYRLEGKRKTNDDDDAPDKKRQRLVGAPTTIESTPAAATKRQESRAARSRTTTAKKGSSKFAALRRAARSGNSWTTWNLKKKATKAEPRLEAPAPVTIDFRHDCGAAVAAPRDLRDKLLSVVQDVAASNAKDEETVEDGMMTVELLKHQRMALAWMLQREKQETCSGGFLADDQGLGKTVSLIALILRARAQLGLSKRKGGTLVVCPTSLMRQWAREIETKVSAAANVSVLVYHGSNRTKDPTELAKYDVVLTTYAIVTLEVPTPEVDEPAGKSREKEKKVKKHVAGALAKVSWFRVILDEAQYIKNAETKASHSCWGLEAEKRWCLSGTPIQNKIEDLFSYFRFLRYAPFDDPSIFEIRVSNLIGSATGYDKLRREILSGVMLRRSKGTVIDGEPILKLPAKHEHMELVSLNPKERKFYTLVQRHVQTKLKEYRKAGTVGRHYMDILVLLLRLRQACCHRFLLRGTMNLNQSPSCKICKDVPEQPVRNGSCGHVFCRQCISSERETSDEPMTKCPAEGCKAPLDSVLSSPTSATTPEIRCETSSKINAVMKHLRRLPPLDPAAAEDAAGKKPVTEKALVFSQWTSFLDLIEPHLVKAGIKFGRLDGTMNVKQRDTAIRDFNDDPEVSVMLMSLKAGSVGLNLVAANHVLLMDLWWNPTVEEQAIDRTHRIGQTRPVHVTRFKVEDSIEDKVVALQKKKRELVSSTFGGQTGKIRFSHRDFEAFVY